MPEAARGWSWALSPNSQLEEHLPSVEPLTKSFHINDLISSPTSQTWQGGNLVPIMQTRTPRLRDSAALGWSTYTLFCAEVSQPEKAGSTVWISVLYQSVMLLGPLGSGAQWEEDRPLPVGPQRGYVDAASSSQSVFWLPRVK